MGLPQSGHGMDSIVGITSLRLVMFVLSCIFPDMSKN